MKETQINREKYQKIPFLNLVQIQKVKKTFVNFHILLKIRDEIVIGHVQLEIKRQVL